MNIELRYAPQQQAQHSMHMSDIQVVVLFTGCFELSQLRKLKKSGQMIF
jgi:hypothetical protein